MLEDGFKHHKLPFTVKFNNWASIFHVISPPPPVPLLRSLLRCWKTGAGSSIRAKIFLTDVAPGGKPNKSRCSLRNIQPPPHHRHQNIHAINLFFSKPQMFVDGGNTRGKWSRCNIYMRYWQPGEMERTEQPVKRSLDKMTGIDGEH